MNTFYIKIILCLLWLKDDLKVKVTAVNRVTGYMDLSSSVQMCYKHHLKRTLHYNLCSSLLSLLLVALGPETSCLMTQSKCHLQSPGDPPIKLHSFWHFGRDVFFNHLSSMKLTRISWTTTVDWVFVLVSLSSSYLRWERRNGGNVCELLRLKSFNSSGCLHFCSCHSS